MFECDPEVGAIITGYDFELSYNKLLVASLYLQTGVSWIVACEDEYSTTPLKKRRVPIEGSLSAALQVSLHDGNGSLLCDKVVTGKPNSSIVQQILSEHNIPKSELSKFIMIGDNPQSDIAMGNAAGIATALTLTGKIKSID